MRKISSWWCVFYFTIIIIVCCIVWSNKHMLVLTVFKYFSAKIFFLPQKKVIPLNHQCILTKNRLQTRLVCLRGWTDHTLHHPSSGWKKDSRRLQKRQWKGVYLRQSCLSTLVRIQRERPVGSLSGFESVHFYPGSYLFYTHITFV